MTHHYGNNASIVFDDCDSSTKDATHQRRSKAHANPSPPIKFRADMICKEKCEDILANTLNKVNLIQMSVMLLGCVLCAFHALFISIGALLMIIGDPVTPKSRYEVALCDTDGDHLS